VTVKAFDIERLMLHTSMTGTRKQGLCKIGPARPLQGPDDERRILHHNFLTQDISPVSFV